MFKPPSEFLGYPLEIQRRAFQRSMNIIVKPNSLIKVTVNKTTPERHIIKFLAQNHSWIEQTQSSFHWLRQKYPAKRFSPSEDFLFLGKNRKLFFKPSVKSKIQIQLLDDQLVIHLPSEQFQDELNNQEWLRPHVLKFYQRQARSILNSRVEVYSKMMQLFPKKLTFRSQKTRWGSCGSNGTISLNWKLIAAPLDKIDYVIVHELAHLKHQNHSKTFWTLVERYSPGSKNHRNWLRLNQYEFDFLAKQPELHFIETL